VSATLRRGFVSSTLARSLLIVAGAALVLLVLSEELGSYQDLQLADGAYYFMALAGLTVLIGASGQISLGHGGLMAVGAYTVALLIGNEGWALVPALIAAARTGSRSTRRSRRRRSGPRSRSSAGKRGSRARAPWSSCSRCTTSCAVGPGARCGPSAMTR
jgi:hypothetical protein